MNDRLEGRGPTEPPSESPQPDQSAKRGVRRVLLIMLGGISLAFCSYVAFFSLERPGVAESAAKVTYASLFFAGVILFLGGCAQAIGLFYKRFRGDP